MARTARPRHSSTRGAAALILTAAALSLISLGAPAASAQAPSKEKRFEPPVPPAPKGSSANLAQLGTVIALAGLVLGACLIPSKRTHQD